MESAVNSAPPMSSVPTVTAHAEEPSDLEELEQFARTFKQRRIKLGFTQVMISDIFCHSSKAVLRNLTLYINFLSRHFFDMQFINTMK